MVNLNVDNGEYRLEDENGNIVARFDESVGEWQLNATNVSGVGAMDAQTVSTDQLSNVETYLSPGADYQSELDAIASSPGSGIAMLKPGTHTIDQVTVPEFVTVRGANGDAGTSVEPSADNPCFILDSSEASVKHLKFDASNIANYSADLIRITADGSRTAEPLVENSFFLGDAANTGAGIAFDDADGAGMAWNTVENIDALGLHAGVRVSTSGGFVNAIAVTVRAFDCEYGILEEASGTTRNRYDIRMNGGGQAISAIKTLGSEHKIHAQVYDHQGFSGPTLDIGARADIRTPVRMHRFAKAADPANTRFHGTYYDRYEYNWTPTLPHWLTTSGTGELSNGAGLVDLSTGTTAGDTFTVNSGGSVGYPDQQPRPWLGVDVDPIDTTGVVHRAGVGGSVDSFYGFIADPSDSLGSGITSNWILGVESRDGSTNYVDSGVAIGAVSMGVLIRGVDDTLTGYIGGTEVGTLDIPSHYHELQPEFRVETTEAVSKTLRLENYLTYEFER